MSIPPIQAADHQAASGAPPAPASPIAQTAEESKQLDLQRDPRVADVYRMLTTASRQKLAVGEEPRPEATIGIDATWSLHIPAEMPEMAKRAAQDLERFLRDELGVALVANDAQAHHEISARIDPQRWHGPGASKRAHAIVVGDSGIEIVGVSEWGVACGFYHLQRLLRLRKAPCITRGTIEAAPTLEPSLTYLAFKTGSMMGLDYPVAYNDEYLCRIARAGYTGFHLDVNVELFAHSKVLPELNRVDADWQLELLRKIVAKSRRYALEVYLTYYSVELAENHPVFLRHPDVRGSWLLASQNQHVLCSSHELTRRFYNEQMTRLFGAIPDLAGIFLIIGCEGIYHCYTAPVRAGIVTPTVRVAARPIRKPRSPRWSTAWQRPSSRSTPGRR